MSDTPAVLPEYVLLYRVGNESNTRQARIRAVDSATAKSQLEEQLDAEYGFDGWAWA